LLLGQGASLGSLTPTLTRANLPARGRSPASSAWAASSTNPRAARAPSPRTQVANDTIPTPVPSGHHARVANEHHHHVAHERIGPRRVSPRQDGPCSTQKTGNKQSGSPGRPEHQGRKSIRPGSVNERGISKVDSQAAKGSPRVSMSGVDRRHSALRGARDHSAVKMAGSLKGPRDECVTGHSSTVSTSSTRASGASGNIMANASAASAASSPATNATLEDLPCKSSGDCAATLSSQQQHPQQLQHQRQPQPQPQLLSTQQCPSFMPPVRWPTDLAETIQPSQQSWLEGGIMNAPATAEQEVPTSKRRLSRLGAAPVDSSGASTEIRAASSRQPHPEPPQHRPGTPTRARPAASRWPPVATATPSATAFVVRPLHHDGNPQAGLGRTSSATAPMEKLDAAVKPAESPARRPMTGALTPPATPPFGLRTPGYPVPIPSTSSCKGSGSSVCVAAAPTTPRASGSDAHTVEALLSACTASNCPVTWCSNPGWNSAREAGAKELTPFVGADSLVRCSSSSSAGMCASAEATLASNAAALWVTTAAAAVPASQQTGTMAGQTGASLRPTLAYTTGAAPHDALPRCMAAAPQSGVSESTPTGRAQVGRSITPSRRSPTPSGRSAVVTSATLASQPATPQPGRSTTPVRRLSGRQVAPCSVEPMPAVSAWNFSGPGSFKVAPPAWVEATSGSSAVTRMQSPIRTPPCRAASPVPPFGSARQASPPPHLQQAAPECHTPTAPLDPRPTTFDAAATAVFSSVARRRLPGQSNLCAQVASMAGEIDSPQGGDGVVPGQPPSTDWKVPHPSAGDVGPELPEFQKPWWVESNDTVETATVNSGAHVGSTAASRKTSTLKTERRRSGGGRAYKARRPALVSSQLAQLQMEDRSPRYDGKGHLTVKQCTPQLATRNKAPLRQAPRKQESPMYTL